MARATVASGEQVRIEGVRPVIEAVRARRRRVWRVELPEPARTPGLRELRDLLVERGIPAVPGREVVGWAEPFPEEPFEQLLLGSPVDFLVALDHVTDVGNLGSIARSAETAGCTGLLLEHRNAPPIREGALRASSGALEHLRVGRAPNLGRALELLRSEGFTVLAAVPGARRLDELGPGRLAGRIAWVFGSEDRGVRSGLLSHADEAVGIPVRGQIASLGVAAAAAFLLHRTAELRAAALPLLPTDLRAGAGRGRQ
jgi:23S rRNA (guanosine2251-2'-O)-methyltransferase